MSHAASETFSDSSAQASRSWCLLSIGAGLFWLVCQIIWIDAAFDHSASGDVGGMYAYSARAFRDCGLWELRFRPSWFYLPGSPASQIPYVNHPPAPHLFVHPFYRLLGQNERALRIPILIVVAIGFVILERSVRKLADARTAALAVGFFALSPIVMTYGNLVDAFPFNMTLIVATTAAFLAWRARESRASYLTFAISAFLFGIADWIGFLAVPFLFLDLFFASPRPQRRFRAAAILLFPFVAAAALNILWMVWALGGFDAMVERMKILSTVPTGADMPALGIEMQYDFAEGMRLWLRHGFRIPLLSAAFLGLSATLMRCILRRTRGLDRFLLHLLAAGGAPIALFWSRSATIEFWLLLIAPAIAVAAGAGIVDLVHAVTRRRVLARTAILLVLAGALAAYSAERGIWLHRYWATDLYPRRGDALNPHLLPNDLCIMTADPGASRFYLDFAAVAPIVSPEAFEITLSELSKSKKSIGRLFVAVSTLDTSAHLWIKEVVAPLRAPTPPIFVPWDKENYAFDGDERRTIPAGGSMVVVELSKNSALR